MYHVEFSPPKVADVDDETGEPLVQRDDDQEDTVRERISVYDAQTQPLVDFYQSRVSDRLRYHRVDGVGSVDSIQAAIFAALGGPSPE